MGLGANRPSYGVAWVAYDRLMTYGRKKLADGTLSYDYNKLEPELLKKLDSSSFSCSITIDLEVCFF